MRTLTLTSTFRQRGAVPRLARSRAAARAAALLATLAAATACSSIRSRFASHDDVFPPVPLSIGEMRVVGSDTSYVLPGNGYTLVATSREQLPDAQQVLDDASRSFKRYLSADPLAVVVDIRVRADSARPARPAPPLAAGGDTIVVPPPPRPRGDRAPRDGMGMSRTPMYLARPVVRSWLTAYATAHARPQGATSTPTTTAPAPGASTAGAAAATSSPAGWGHDPRVPDWLEQALYELVLSSPFLDMYVAQLAMQSSAELIPLRTLFDSTLASAPAGAPGVQGDTAARGAVAAGGPPARPPAGTPGGPSGGPGGGPAARPERRGGRGMQLDRSALFGVEAVAVAQFLAAREGPQFIGDLTDRLLTGGRVDDVLLEARVVPKSVEALEPAWRAWLAQQRPEGPRG
jgi:hypothetical protein